MNNSIIGFVGDFSPILETFFFTSKLSVKKVVKKKIIQWEEKINYILVGNLVLNSILLTIFVDSNKVHSVELNKYGHAMF